MNPEQIVKEKMYANDAFSQWLGIQVLQVAAGGCLLEMCIRPEMCNGFGIAHGGIAYSLADSCLAFASNAQGRQALSTETSISHLALLRIGDTIIAEAKEEFLGQSSAVYSVYVRKKDTNELVALFKGTVFRTKKEY